MGRQVPSGFYFGRKGTQATLFWEVCDRGASRLWCGLTSLGFGLLTRPRVISHGTAVFVARLTFPENRDTVFYPSIPST